MKLYTLAVSLFVFSCLSDHSNAQIIEQITMTPINPIVSQSGDEIISDFLIGHSDGTTEYLSTRYGDSVFWYSGTSVVPPVSSFPLIVHATDLGFGGPGPGFTFPQNLNIPSTVVDETKPNFEDENVQVAPLLIYIGVAGGGAAATASACAAGWFMARRTLRDECSSRGGRLVSMEIGRCGIGGTSRIDCDYPEVPDPPPGLGISWGAYAYGGGLPLSFNIDGFILDLSVPGLSDH